MSTNRYTLFFCLVKKCHFLTKQTQTIHRSPINVSVTKLEEKLLPMNHYRINGVLGVVFYSTDSKNDKPKDSLTKHLESSTQKKTKKEIKTYITLLGIDKSMSVTTVEDAKKLATRRNLKLLKVIDFDTKTSRAVYQLMTESQYLKDDKDWEGSISKKDKFIKGNKVVSFSSNISEHDTLVKVKLMKKWLSKDFEARIVISGDKNSAENIYKIIERELGNDGRIVQKRAKGSDIRFQVIPPKKTGEKTLNKTSTDSEKENT